MIYVGYQGIGKSTICHQVLDCIDLESSNFFVDGKRDENWYKIYTNIANHLSNQGKSVFTSSHKVLREYMNEQGIPFTVIYPSLKLKSQWIRKLEQRYNSTQKEKDCRAWINAAEMYEDNINDLSKEKHQVVITNIDYSLRTIILADSMTQKINKL